jgi:hypothetical protein
MTYTCTVSGYVIYNAATSCIPVSRDNNVFSYSFIEEKFNIKFKQDIINTLKWQYIAEFSSETDAILFLLRFS